MSQTAVRQAGIRHSLAIALRREGHDVEAASDAVEGAAAVRRGGIDVVLTDVRMPGDSGARLST